MMARRAWSPEADPAGVRTAMINSRAVPVPLTPSYRRVAGTAPHASGRDLPTPCQRAAASSCSAEGCDQFSSLSHTWARPDFYDGLIPGSRRLPIGCPDGLDQRLSKVHFAWCKACPIDMRRVRAA